MLQATPKWLAGLRGSRPVRLMAGPYKNRGGLGKSEANGFLTDMPLQSADLWARAPLRFAKTIVIQNLFQNLRDACQAREIF